MNPAVQSWNCLTRGRVGNYETQHREFRQSLPSSRNRLARSWWVCCASDCRPATLRKGSGVISKSSFVPEASGGSNLRERCRKKRFAFRPLCLAKGISHVFAFGKSRGTRGKRFVGEQLWRVIRRTSQSSSAILMILGYAALTEQGASGRNHAKPQSLGYESVLRITEQVV
jgi:hypothetical protein